MTYVDLTEISVLGLVHPYWLAQMHSVLVRMCITNTTDDPQLIIARFYSQEYFIGGLALKELAWGPSN